jgi:hypothetical protein
MAVMAEELVPVLEDARQAHTAVLDRFRADAAVTPPGAYRQMLERQAAEVQVSLQRIQHRVRDLRPRGIFDTAAGVTRFVSQGAVRTAMLPLTIGTGIVREILPGGPADARQLLRNAEGEYAAAARALAACRAGEVLAEQVDDEGTARLLGALRRQDEELLQALEDSLAEQARAVVASANGVGSRGNHQGGVADAAGRTVRTAVDRARHVARSGVRRAGGGDTTRTVRGVPEPGPMAEEVLGAVRREEDLPIPGFSQLSTEQIRRRLPTLSQLDLTVIEGYEHAHARRKRVLDAIERLRGAEPWTGYDALHTDDVVASLRDAPSDQARQVREYEERHRRRREVISAARARVSG